MDKVREYINFTFQNKIDREIIMYLNSDRYLGPRIDRTATGIFNRIRSNIPSCKRPTFDKRLEALISDRFKAIEREIAKPEDLDPTIWDKKHRGEPLPPPPRHRLPYLYSLSPSLVMKIRDVDEFASIVYAIRTARRLGRPIPGLTDEKIIEMFLEREERGIFIPGHISEE